jgi:glycosyltransferase involved in cell wall biosynthesis
MITVAICTHNNAALLAGTLDSLLSMTTPELDYEVLVVDNNSGDHTSQVVDAYGPRFGGKFRSTFEPQLGLSHARNRALKEARGDIVAFIDDDVEVAPDWLSAVEQAFRTHGASVVGGKSYLILPGPRPAWLTPRLEAELSRLDYGDETIVNTEEDLFGLNFSVQRDQAIALGGFDTTLGRSGQSLASGEETEFLRRTRAAGGIPVYEPRAVVGHVVPPQRLTRRWFRRRALAAGKSRCRCDINAGTCRSVRAAIEDALRCAGSAARAQLSGRTATGTRFERRLAAIRAWGYLLERVFRAHRG